MNDAWVRVSRESESRGRPRRERTNGSRAESRPRRPTSRPRSSRSLEEETRHHHGVGRPSFIRIRRGGVVLVVVARERRARWEDARGEGNAREGCARNGGDDARDGARRVRARDETLDTVAIGGRRREGTERPSSRRSVREDDGDGRTATRASRARRTVGWCRQTLKSLRKSLPICSRFGPSWPPSRG